MTSALQKIPANVRGVLYVVWGVVTLGLAMWGGWYQALGEAAPDIVTRLTYVWGIFGAAFAFTAAGNSTNPEKGEDVIVAVPDIELEQSASDGLEIDPDTIPDADATLAS